MDFYLHKDLDGLGAGGSCGPAHNVPCQNPEAAIVLSSAAVVLRTAQHLVNASFPTEQYIPTSPCSIPSERRGSCQTYLQECVFTLPVEVEPLLIKCGVVAISVDPTNCITLVAGAYELALTAVAVGTPTRHTLSIHLPSFSVPV